MLVYVDTPKAVTFKTFRDKAQAAKFANAHARNVLSIRHEHGRIIVRFLAKSAPRVWSRNREESARNAPTYKIAPENWPNKYR